MTHRLALPEIGAKFPALRRHLPEWQMNVRPERLQSIGIFLFAASRDAIPKLIEDYRGCHDRAAARRAQAAAGTEGGLLLRIAMTAFYRADTT
jgi:hypothetical protein